jgi:hypothetical protein
MAGRVAYYGGIVTNGLVLNLDAAKRDSYPGSGTTWRDISGNQNNGTLTNGPTFNSDNGGSFVFDGADDYVTTNYNAQLQNFTACIWFKANSLTTIAGRLLDKDYLNGFWLGKNPNGSLNSWGGGVRDLSFPYGRYITLTDNQWHYIVSIRNNTTHTIYGDGITNTISGTVSTTATNASSLWFGRENNIGPSLYKGNISQVKIYNRALTAQEVLQNYNATKGRYGL